MSFHIPLYTSIYLHEYTSFQLLPQDFHKDPPTSVRSTWKFPLTSMETSMEQNFTSWKSIYFLGSFHESRWKEVGGSRFTSMEVCWSLHGSTWKFPLSVGVQASISSINSSHGYILWELPWASTHPYKMPSTPTTIKLPAASTRLTLTLNPNPKLELPPWKPAYLQLPWKYMEVHGRNMLLPWTLEPLAWILTYFQLPWNLVEASMVRRWK